MSNSSLVTYTNLSPNKTTIANKVNNVITIHCIVGQWTAKQGADYFAQPSAKASANYIVGKDGSIAQSVDEKDRAWTTGGKLSVNGETGAMNDRHAVTIEVASDTTHPYAITDAAYKALVNLVADIAKRNNMGELKWKADSSLVGRPDLQNLTVHRWFATKACPGDYIYERLGDIAKEANAINAAAGAPVIKPVEPTAANYDATIVADVLNCRKEPINGSIVTQYKKNTKVHISKELNGWGYTGEGWVSLVYVEKIVEQKPVNEQDAALTWVKEQGLMLGDENGNMMPNNNLTRAQFAIVLKRFADKYLK